MNNNEIKNDEHDYLGDFCYDFVRTIALVTLREMAYSESVSGDEFKEQSKGVFRLLSTNAKHYTRDSEEFRGAIYDH